MATVGFATLDVIPSVRGLRAQLDKQVNPGLAAAGRKGGRQFGEAAGTQAAQGFSSKMKSGLDGMGGKLFAGLGVAAAGKAVIGLQADFESSINVLGASADLTSAQMQQMSRFAKKMGADTVFSAGEAADAMVELAKAGLSPANIQAGALKATMAVAATEGLQLADAATIVSNAMTTFKIEGGRASEVADALAGGSKASTASVASLAEAMSQVGGSAVDAGLSLQETVAALSAFDQEGIKGSDAGTSLKTMLSRLVPQTDKAANAMADLGLNFTDAQGQFLPLADIAGQLQRGLSGLSDAERTTALNTIFGTDARRAAIALMHQGKKGIEDFTQATSEAGAAQKLADARMKGTKGSIEQLRGSIENLGLEIGETLAPVTMLAADGIGSLADVVAKVPSPVMAAALAFGALKVASSFGLSGPTANIGTLSRSLDGLRLRTMLATDAFRSARAGSLMIEGGFGKLTPGVGRLSASLRGLSTFATGAGSALKRGLGGAVGMLGGPWGIAMIAGVTALTKFKQSQAEAKARVEALTDSLDAQTGALTKSSREAVFKALQDSGAVDAAKDLGINLKTLTDAAIGNEKALASVNSVLDQNIAKSSEAARVNGGRGAGAIQTQNVAMGKLREALNGQNSEIEKSKQAWHDQAEAMGTSAATSETAVQGMRDYAGEIEKARGSLQGLIDAEKKRAENALKRKGDELALVVALQDARKEAREGAKTLDITTKAGQENREELYALAQQWQSSGDKVKNAKGAYVSMRQNFIDVAREMGATKKQAETLADKLLDVPKTAPVKFQSEGFQERLREIQELRRQMRALREVANLNYGAKPKAPALERASGGPVFGAGTATSDSIPAWLSNGEFVQRTKAVNYYGLDFMRRLNNLQIPKFAQGGPVVQQSAPASAGLVIDQRGSTFQVADYKDFQRQTQARAARAGLSGVRSQ